MVTAIGTPPDILVAGAAVGQVAVLDEPLSFWGGFDARSGTISDRRHPQFGLLVSKRVLLMPAARGSSSSSSVLAESIRLRTAPAAILLGLPDEILALGAIVAEELYGLVMPIAVLTGAAWNEVAAAESVELRPSGELFVL